MNISNTSVQYVDGSGGLDFTPADQFFGGLTRRWSRPGYHDHET